MFSTAKQKLNDKFAEPVKNAFIVAIFALVCAVTALFVAVAK